MSEVKVYSPSAIKAYAECPMLYELHYLDGIELREADRLFWGGVAGDMFGCGIRAWYTSGKDEQAMRDAALAIGEETVLAHATAGGRYYQGDYESVKADVMKALDKYVKADPLSGWTDLQFEVSLPDCYGRPRLDVLGRDPQGVLALADFKFKRNLETQWVAKTVDEYRRDWQFMHYAWAARAHFKEPVHVYLALVRLRSAWQAQLFEFTYQDELLDMVGQSVMRWSEDMARAVNRGPALGTTHDTKFGPCRYQDACLKYRLDPQLMTEKYITIPRKGVTDAQQVQS